MDDLNNMYKKLGFFDIIIGIILVVVSYIVNIIFVIPSISGLVVAAVNFYISGKITVNTVIKGKINTMFIMIYVLRIFFVCIIGLLFFTYNKYDLIAYLIGFISHFVSLILYALSIKDK